MFFDTAGGTQYTGLWDAHQHFVDGSGLLDAGQAMLVGFADEIDADTPGTAIRDGQEPLAAAHTARTVVFRFVVPVKTIAEKH